MRICSGCEIEKPLTTENFQFRKSRGAFGKKCKSCLSKDYKAKYAQDSQKIRERIANYRATNIDRIRAKARIYNNTPKVKESNRKYRENNKDLIRLNGKIWREENPERYKEIRRRKDRKSRKLPKNKIKTHVSRQINFALKRSGFSKAGNSVLLFLPYTIEELKCHLENQFDYWMTWQNYGVLNKNWNNNDPTTWTWQIDHIVPQSVLPYSSMTDDNFKKCWKLDNLRPLSSKINALDGCTRVRHKQ